jgi:glycosyltransferase involved in cell wall biosynthesis
MKINGEKVISMKPQSKLKVAHFAHVTPNQAGIAGTAIDMVMAERTVGIDSQIIDFQGNGKPCRMGLECRGVKPVGPSWAGNADIIVRHSAVPQTLKNSGKPIIMCLHGRPEYGFLLQYYKKMGLLAEWFKCARDPCYRTFITFWKEHLNYLKIMMPNSKIDYVPAMVDLKNFMPSGIKYDYDNIGGTPNIVIADMFREDVNPFNVLVAASVFVHKYCPEARVHIYGLQRTKESPVKDLLDKMKEAIVIGEAKPLVTEMERVYRSADMLITPHHIATRVIREALASGVPIVAGVGCPYTNYTEDARYTEGFAAKINDCWNDIKDDKQTAKNEARAMAEKSFNLKQAGEAALKIYERVMKEPKPKIVVRTKTMIYNFIVYATDSEGGGKDVGAAYNRYMKLLPKDDDWACFIDHDAMFTTEDWFKNLGEILAANPEYGLLTACTNRIGNHEQKIANLQDTHDMLYHRAIGRQLRQQGDLTIKDVTNTHCISGVVMLIKKSVWKAAGGFKEGGFLGVDNDFHMRVVKSGGKIGVMRGVYVYHCYRADSESGLRPVG